MKKFCIIFRTEGESYYCNSKTIEAISALSALIFFTDENPDAVFIVMYDLEVHTEYPFTTNVAKVFDPSETITPDY